MNIAKMRKPYNRYKYKSFNVKAVCCSYTVVPYQKSDSPKLPVKKKMS